MNLFYLYTYLRQRISAAQVDVHVDGERSMVSYYIGLMAWRYRTLWACKAINSTAGSEEKFNLAIAKGYDIISLVRREC